jgi:hypothetical protein
MKRRQDKMDLTNIMEARYLKHKKQEQEVAAKISKDFNQYLNSKAFQRFLRKQGRAGEEYIYLCITFETGLGANCVKLNKWFAWGVPGYIKTYSSHFDSFTLFRILQEDLSNKLKNKMSELGFKCTSCNPSKAGYTIDCCFTWR